MCNRYHVAPQKVKKSASGNENVPTPKSLPPCASQNTVSHCTQFLGVQNAVVPSTIRNNLMSNAVSLEGPFTENDHENRRSSINYGKETRGMLHFIN